MKPIIVDAHQDLAWNMLTFGRDYSLPVQETRRKEAGSETPKRNGDTMLGWPDFQNGRVAIIFATLFVSPVRRKLGVWDRQTYTDISDAFVKYKAQAETYQKLVEEHDEKFILIQTRNQLESCISAWENPKLSKPPVGLLLLMEGAESVRTPSDLEYWWHLGVRIIGPAWAGNRYCGGTGEPGPLTQEGVILLENMAAQGFILDVSHMDEQAVLQALDVYEGPVIATHANANALLKGIINNRHLSDRVLQGLLDRDGVIGLIPINPFLKVGWEEADGRDKVSIRDYITQIDYVCQMAGDASHAGIGTDFDGGFGLQSVPYELDYIADLQKITLLLEEKGYSEKDIAAIMGKNWINQINKVLPESI